MESSLLDSSLRVGIIVGVSANGATINLSHAGLTSGSYHLGNRYGRGEVGEIILIEGQESLSIGKILDIRIPEKERSNLNAASYQNERLDAIGYVQLLGTVNTSSLLVSAGIANFPRIGDAVFSAPSYFLSMIPKLMDNSDSDEESLLNVGFIPNHNGSFHIGPEKLFGRHCAILGSTGGGKSWTTARLVQECAKFKNSKVILVDATGEYRSLPDSYTQHMHLGNPLHLHPSSLAFRIPPTDFDESDFITLFEPSGKVQGPKLRAAIRSLRLVHLDPEVADNGILHKINQPKTRYRKALKKNDNASLVDKPSQPFNIKNLIRQIQQECHFIENDGSWGRKNENEISYCSSLFTRILGVLNSPAFTSVFDESGAPSLDDVISTFLTSKKQILRLCLSSTSYEFHAREILANALGRKLMSFARREAFIKKPLLAILDEAHNFLGKKIGIDENAMSLDAFEIIAKEGRKYGLNICLATQRPRDITEGVISQMGTLIVHRLTNNNDRDVIERACGEADSSIISFLPNLRQGEAAILGVDFPIPLTIQIHRPSPTPLSDSPDYRTLWS